MTTSQMIVSQSIARFRITKGVAKIPLRGLGPAVRSWCAAKYSLIGNSAGLGLAIESMVGDELVSSFAERVCATNEVPGSHLVGRVDACLY